MAKEFVLRDGKIMPSVAFGTFKDTKTITEAVECAILNGYRHLDLAYVYKNEEMVGEGIRRAIEHSNGSIKREDLFITNKLYPSYFSREAALKMLDRQLSACKLDYFDLYLIHWPTPFEEGGDDIPLDENGFVKPSNVDIRDTWRVLEEIKAMGKARSIGVSNFNEKQLELLLASCKEPPVVNQTEVNPYVPCTELVEFCKKHNIVVEAYAPLGAGDRQWRKPEDPVLLNDPVIKEVASELHTTPALVIIRWLLQRGIVVVVKSSTPSRIKENISVYDIALPDSAMAKISSISRRFRYYQIPWLIKHPNYPYPIWDQ